MRSPLIAVSVTLLVLSPVGGVSLRRPVTPAQAKQSTGNSHTSRRVVHGSVAAHSPPHVNHAASNSSSSTQTSSRASVTRASASVTRASASASASHPIPNHPNAAAHATVQRVATPSKTATRTSVSHPDVTHPIATRANTVPSVHSAPQLPSLPKAPGAVQSVKSIPATKTLSATAAAGPAVAAVKAVPAVAHAKAIPAVAPAKTIPAAAPAKTMSGAAAPQAKLSGGSDVSARDQGEDQDEDAFAERTEDTITKSCRDVCGATTGLASNRDVQYCVTECESCAAAHNCVSWTCTACKDFRERSDIGSSDDDLDLDY